MKCLKEKHLLEIEIFCNIINVFTVTFDDFNACLLIKSINFFLKQTEQNHIYPKRLSISARLKQSKSHYNRLKYSNLHDGQALKSPLFYQSLLILFIKIIILQPRHRLVFKIKSKFDKQHKSTT